ncbi:unnamed protein product [Leptosia nina]|uniref:Uncharacterized protein n=1 Tax=Leptosia nina TaxID=320188 RepID=A0AAV1IW73_9NEOP
MNGAKQWLRSIVASTLTSPIKRGKLNAESKVLCAGVFFLSPHAYCSERARLRGPSTAQSGSAGVWDRPLSRPRKVAINVNMGSHI